MTMNRRLPNFLALALSAALTTRANRPLTPPASVKAFEATRPRHKGQTKKGGVHYRNGLNRAQQARTVKGDVTELRAKKPGRAALRCTVHEPVKSKAYHRPDRY